MGWISRRDLQNQLRQQAIWLEDVRLEVAKKTGLWTQRQQVLADKQYQ